MTTSYSNVLKIEFSTMRPDEFNADIRSLDTVADGRRIVLGTAISELFELSTTDVKITSNSRFDKDAINKGVFSMNSFDRFEMWGLAVFRTQENAGKFITVSDDGYLRIWSVNDRERKMEGFVELHANSKNIPDPYSDDARLRCVAISPKEDFAAVGCKSGAIRVRSVLTKIVNLKEQKQIQIFEDPRGCIRELKYSPNGNYLAVGCDNNALEIYSVPDYKRRANLKKHSGPVIHIDWSSDSKYLMTNSESQELLFFSMQDFQHITDPPANIRNEHWSTHNCVYNWSTQGIWRKHMKLGSEIYAADRTNGKFFDEYQTIATGDDFGEIRVYKYPCVQPAAESVICKGHSSFVSNLKWMPDESRLITVGGEDQTIIVWRLHRSLF